jgi:hypothetical protein
MPISNATLGEMTKRVYAPENIVELQNLEVPILRLIGEAPDKRLGGDGLYFAVDPSGDEGYGYTTDTGRIPDPQNEQIQQAKVTPTVLLGACRITGLARSITSQDVMAFARAYQFSMDKKLRRMSAYKESVLFRDGKGMLLQINEAIAVPATNTAVDMDTGVFSWVRRNMMVEFFNSAGLYKTGPHKVADVDVVNQQVTFDSDFSALVANNDGMYLADTQPRSGGLVEREPWGLEKAIATTGTYLDIDRATVPEWEGNVVDAAGNDLDEDRLLQAEQRVYILGGVSMGRIKDFRLLIHPFQLRKYFELIIPRREFAGTSFDAGYGRLSWNGHEFLVTHNCPETTVWMGDFSQWQKFTAPNGDLQIDTTFGSAIKWAPGFDAGLSYFREYMNYGIRRPVSWVKIEDLGSVANR